MVNLKKRVPVRLSALTRQSLLFQGVGCWCLGLIFTVQAHAQSALPDPSPEQRRELQEQQRRRELANPVEPAIPLDLRAESLDELPDGETPCFAIQRVRLDVVGDHNFDWALSAKSGHDGLDDPVGRCLGVQGIGLVQKRIQNAIVARGYITTRVLVMNQNLSQGTLSLNVLPGRFDQIQDQSVPEAKIDVAQLLDLESGDVMNLRAVEQALEHMHRLPSVKAQLQIDPSTTPMHSNLQLKWQQDRAWRLAYSLDDAGSDSTGRYQHGLNLTVDNPLGLSDLTYVNVTTSQGGTEGPKPKGSQSVAFHYSVPYDHWLMSFNANTSRYHQTVLGAFENYEYSGSSDSFDVALARVFWRDSRQVWTANTGLTRRASNNFIDDTEIEVQRRVIAAWDLGVSHRYHWGDITLQSQYQFRQGLDALGALPAPEEAFSEGTSQMRISTLSTQLAVPGQWSGWQWRYDASVRLQIHHTPLTPQDRFSIGGRYTVRGYDNNSTLVGDSGWLWRNEWGLKHPGWPAAGVYVGLDMGRIQGPSAETQAGDQLIGSALGLRGDWHGLRYDLFYGRALQHPKDMKVPANTAGFAMQWTY